MRGALIGAICAAFLAAPTFAPKAWAEDKVDQKAEQLTPVASDLLFEQPQLAATRPGDTLTYAYSRKSSEPAIFGPPFEDRLTLAIAKGSEPQTRNVEVKMFSGANRKPAGPFDDMTGNPLLSLVLEENVQLLSEKLQVNPRYLKNAIRAALRDKAQVTPDLARLGGKETPGWRVSVTPFENDPNRARMRGLEGLAYTFRVAKAVPGEIFQIDIAAPDKTGGALFEERVDYVDAAP